MSPDPSPDPLARWAESIGLDAAPREPWLGGAVHLLDGIRSDGEVETGRTYAHQVIVLTRDLVARERTVGGPLHYEGLQRRGPLLFGSAAANEHDIRSEWEGEAYGFSVAVEPRVTDALCRGAGIDPAAVEYVSAFGLSGRDPVLEWLVLALGTEARSGFDGFGRVYAESLMQALAAHLVRQYTAGSTRLAARGGLPAQRLARVEAYVRAHLASSLSLDDLAGAAGLSPFHFARAFRQTTGQTPFAFVRALRMEAAVELLREHRHWSVVAVALAVGYQSPTSFAAAFRAHWGASPSAYRRDRA